MSQRFQVAQQAMLMRHPELWVANVHVLLPWAITLTVVEIIITLCVGPTWLLEVTGFLVTAVVLVWLVRASQHFCSMRPPDRGQRWRVCSIYLMCMLAIAAPVFVGRACLILRMHTQLTAQEWASARALLESRTDALLTHPSAPEIGAAVALLEEFPFLMRFPTCQAFELPSHCAAEVVNDRLARWTLYVEIEDVRRGRLPDNGRLALWAQLALIGVVCAYTARCRAYNGEAGMSYCWLVIVGFIVAFASTPQFAVWGDTAGQYYSAALLVLYVSLIASMFVRPHSELSTVSVAWMTPFIGGWYERAGLGPERPLLQVAASYVVFCVLVPRIGERLTLARFAPRENHPFEDAFHKPR